jgi:hypothetical protein
MCALQADPTGDRVRMERLLNSSFLYLGVADLKDVPLAVMEKLDKVRHWGWGGRKCARMNQAKDAFLSSLSCLFA